MAKTAYLTFDDGPTKNSQAIRDILDQGHAKGTFFIQGNHIQEKYRELLQKMAQEGHYLGLHSMTHQHDWLYVHQDHPQNFLGEMREVQELLAGITGHESTLYRPPFGSHGNFTDPLAQTMKESGLRCWDWHIDTKDWDIATTAEEIFDKVKTYIEENVAPSPVVILFHEHHESTLQSLPRVIKYLQSKGYHMKAYQESEHFTLNSLQIEGL